jgi:DNA-binding transcriptional ArsR family regulator
MANPRPVTTSDVDVSAVRALAHPLRLRLLDLLRFDGPATATMLAERVGESTGSTSYHLRQLARHGFIEDAPRRDGRERWWSYLERRVDLGDTIDRSDARTLLGELLSREAYALDRYLSAKTRDEAWDDAAFFHSKALTLTSAQLEELRDVVDQTLTRLAAESSADGAPAESLPVRVLAFGFPQPEA